MDKYISSMDLCMEYIISLLTCKNIKKNGLLNKVSDMFHISTNRYSSNKKFAVPIENINRFYLTIKYSNSGISCNSDYIYFILKKDRKYYIVISYINSDTYDNNTMVNIILYKNNDYIYTLSKNLGGKPLTFGTYFDYYAASGDEFIHMYYDKNNDGRKKIDQYKIEDSNEKNIILSDPITGDKYIVVDYKLQSLSKIRQETSSYLYWNIIMLSDGYLNIKN